MFWNDNMCIPLYAAEPAGRHDVHGLRVRPEGAGTYRGLQQLRLPGARGQGHHPERAEGPEGGQQPHGVPDAADESLSRTYYQYKNNQDLHARGTTCSCR